MAKLPATCAAIIIAVSACSSLKITDTQPTTGKKSGVPVSLPMQEFIITKYGINKNGAAAGQDKFVVSLVTKPDPDRKFFVSHRGALLATTGFALERSANGVVTSVSGSSDENATEAIQTIATFVGAATGAFASGTQDELNRIEKESSALEIIHEEAATKLRNSVGGRQCQDRSNVAADGTCSDGSTPTTTDPLGSEEVKRLQTILQNSADRLVTLATRKKALTAKSVGEKPSERISPELVFGNELIAADGRQKSDQTILDEKRGSAQFVVILREAS